MCLNGLVEVQGQIRLDRQLVRSALTSETRVAVLGQALARLSGWCRQAESSRHLLSFVIWRMKELVAKAHE